MRRFPYSRRRMPLDESGPSLPLRNFMRSVARASRTSRPGTTSTKLADNESIVGAGDDAQLLAGATMAVLARPSLYDQSTRLVNDGLDDSYQHDPIWAGLSLDQMFSPSFLALRHAAPAGGKAPRKHKVS